MTTYSYGTGVQACGGIDYTSRIGMTTTSVWLSYESAGHTLCIGCLSATLHGVDSLGSHPLNTFLLNQLIILEVMKELTIISISPYPVSFAQNETRSSRQ